MSSLTQPLQYKISDWHQLIDCKSNNSRQLHIRVADILNDDRLSGTRISVVHDDFGVLFSYIVNPRGRLITMSESDDLNAELSPSQILAELSRYGFLIQYNVNEHLKGDQLTFLMTLSQLHFDKIRLLNVYSTKTGVKEFHLYIVAFNSAQNTDWLNNGYSPSLSEFSSALLNGSAYNVSGCSDASKYNWSWLRGWVANISDILAENSRGANYEK